MCYFQKSLVTKSALLCLRGASQNTPGSFPNPEGGTGAQQGKELRFGNCSWHCKTGKGCPGTLRVARAGGKALRAQWSTHGAGAGSHHLLHTPLSWVQQEYFSLEVGKQLREQGLIIEEWEASFPNLPEIKGRRWSGPIFLSFCVDSAAVWVPMPALVSPQHTQLKGFWVRMP